MTRAPGEARERGREVGQETAEQARENRENAGRPDDTGRPDDAGPPPTMPVRPTIPDRRKTAARAARNAAGPPIAASSRSSRSGGALYTTGSIPFSWLAMSRALLLTIACLIMAFARAAAGADASALFADGERAFAAGEYQEALRLFTAAREAGSTGPSSYYNIGVCQYRLRDYAAAEATFATLAAEFPAMRELAEYNRGLALRATGNLADARVAFERARSSTDDKIVALANAQLGEIGAPRRSSTSRDGPAILRAGSATTTTWRC